MAVKQIFEADTAKAISDLSKLIAKQQQMITGLQDTNRASRGASDAFGALTTRAMQFASSYVGIAAVSNAIGQVETAADAAGERIRKMTDDLKALVQASEGVQQSQEYQKLAKQIAGQTGMSEQQAIRLTTTGAQAGLSNAEIVELSKTHVFDSNIEQVTDVVTDVMRQWGDQIKSPRDAINIIGAGQISTKDTLSQMGPKFLELSGIAKGLGWSPVEVSAFLETVSRGTSKEKGLTYAVQLANAMATDTKRRFTKNEGGAKEDFDTLLGLNDPKLNKLIGERKEAWQGYRIVKDRYGEVLQNIDEVERERALGGTDRDYYARKQAEAEQDPRIMASREADIARIQREMSEQEAGMREFKDSSRKDIYLRDMQQRYEQDYPSMDFTDIIAQKIEDGLTRIGLEIHDALGTLPTIFGEGQQTQNNLIGVLERLDSWLRAPLFGGGKKSPQPAAVE